ncbi:hypothetical protein SAMN05216228_104231 [Rhizobium tibeticum]|uniref:Uncharacterized protein n=1 Tax=Rhizobium tibeticum TaxID=501024 RepID=A0A1H8VGR4_9HYPH|nr:hypothetical protein RTCCBAU85039_6022 [Rhizobium tibeticum]SEP14483.1 hypothetical protein SAMN05216228_104231 [Rhizobium tibeticum]
MAWIWHVRDAALIKQRPQLADTILVTRTLEGLTFRCWIEATAPAASAGGSAVVKMKPMRRNENLTQSTSSSDDRRRGRLVNVRVGRKRSLADDCFRAQWDTNFGPSVAF